LGKSFEVRNIDFWGAPEDAVGMEGVQSGTTITAPVERCWVHNNTFEPQKIANPAESDKAEGDGCCDFKRGQYFTMDYNVFIGAHKTSLVGSSDSSLQYHITSHHNYYINCESRGPLARQGNIHMYNNYYKGQSSYVISARANSYIFSEYNNYIECKNVVQLKSGGVVKSFNDNLLSCSGDKDAVFVSSRDEAVESSNIYKGFETDSSLSYIPSGKYSLDTTPEAAKASVFAYAGVMKESVVKATDVNTSNVVESNVPTAAVAVPYKVSLTNSNTNLAQGHCVVDNIVYNISKKPAADSITITEQGVIFKLDKAADVVMTAVTGTVMPALSSENGTLYISGSGAATLQPGVYIIQSDTFDPGKSVYKESKLASLEFAEAGSVVATKPDESTQATTTDQSTEATTEDVTVADGCVDMGTYAFNKDTVGSAAVMDDDYTANEMVFNNIVAVENDKIEINNDSTITFEVDRDCTFTAELGNDNGIVISTVVGGKITDGTTAVNSVTTKKTATYKLSAGSYTVTGLNASNSAVTGFVFGDVSEPSKGAVIGDITGDGKVTATDSAVILAYLNGLRNIDNVADLDINGDGSVNAKDATDLLKHVRDNDYTIGK
jgi:hypothetical protein